MKEEFVETQAVYEGDFLQMRRDKVRLANQAYSTRDYVVHPGAVVIIAIDKQQRVVMERQYRYPVRQVEIEFPAGKLDPNEAPLAAAQRELKEETGIRARSWAYAAAVHPIPAYSTEVLHIFFAQDLIQEQAQPDADELLEVFYADLPQIQHWCASGEIRSAITLSATLWLQNVLSGLWSLDWFTIAD